MVAPGGGDKGRQRLVGSVEAGAAYRRPDEEDPGEGEWQQDKDGVGTCEAKQSGTGHSDGEQHEGVRAGAHRLPELRIGTERLCDAAPHIGGKGCAHAWSVDVVAVAAQGPNR